MDPKEANQIRCMAHELIIKLMDAGENTHLHLLQLHCESAIKKICDSHKKQAMEERK